MMSDEMLKEILVEEEMAIVGELPDPTMYHHEFSPEFEEKMQKLIQKTKRTSDYQVLKRVACILISFLLFAGAFLSVQVEAEASILGWIKEQFEGAYHYFFERSEDPSEVKSYYLGWVPKGYELVESLDVSFGEYFIFKNDENKLFYFYCMHGSDSNSLFEGNGNFKSKTIRKRGLKADLLLSTDNKRTNSITWKSDDGLVVFSILGYLTENDLVKMAQNVKINK